MESAKSVWKWLDGNKTLFGTLMLAAVPYVPHPLAQTTLIILGTALGGVGVFHKIAKGRAALKKPEQ